MCLFWVVLWYILHRVQNCRKYLCFQLQNAITEATKEIVWLQTFVEELGRKCSHGALQWHFEWNSFCHESCILLHDQAGHIQLGYYLIQYLLSDGRLRRLAVGRTQQICWPKESNVRSWSYAEVQLVLWNEDKGLSYRDGWSDACWTNLQVENCWASWRGT